MFRLSGRMLPRLWPWRREPDPDPFGIQAGMALLDQWHREDRAKEHALPALRLTQPEPWQQCALCWREATHVGATPDGNRCDEHAAPAAAPTPPDPGMCPGCGGTGWLIVHNEDTREDEVQRCDMCLMLPDDATALRMAPSGWAKPSDAAWALVWARAMRAALLHLAGGSDILGSETLREETDAVLAFLHARSVHAMDADLAVDFEMMAHALRYAMTEEDN